MKKIYINLCKLSMSLALVFSLGQVSTAQCDIEPPAGAIAGTQFDGGLDGWTATDGNFEERKDADGNDIGWTWSATGDVSAGAYAGNAPLPETPSACNGAMVLNSDFLDNEGIPGNFAMGACPAPCGSALISPTYDLSGADADVFLLQMSTMHRNFQSSYSVQYSTDDGATWSDPINVYGGLTSADGYIETMVNSPHLQREFVNIPLCGLGKESAVKIAISSAANYYYWVVDDVWIIGAQGSDLRVNENFFAGTTVNHGTPADQASPLAFVADIENRSPMASGAATLNVEVVKNGEETVYSASLPYEPIDGCADRQNQVFPETYTPVGEPGDVFDVIYTIDAEGDAFDFNNSQSSYFQFTSDEFLQVLPEDPLSPYLRNSRFGSENVYQGFGTAFHIESGTRDGQQLFFDKVNFGLRSDGLATDPLSQGLVEVVLYEWVDVSLDGLIDIDEKVRVGEAILFTSTVVADDVSNRNIELEIRDENGAPIPLSDNTQYVVMMHFNPFSGLADDRYRIFYAPSELYNEFDNEATEYALDSLGNIENLWSGFKGTVGTVGGGDFEGRDDQQFFGVFWGSVLCNVTVQSATSSEDINQDVRISVFPNPATDFIYADVSLAETSEFVKMELIDMQGQLVQAKSFRNISSDRLALDVSALTSGTYILNVRTDAGINTKKVTVVNQD